jgi:ketosteroid isomerase-like protein
VTGRAAVTEFWANALVAGIASAVLTTEEVSYAGGDTATEIGSAVLSAKDGSVVDEGKYIVLWKQEDGTWRLHRDIWNSNRAPATPSESEPPAADAVDAGAEPPPPR